MIQNLKNIIKKLIFFFNTGSNSITIESTFGLGIKQFFETLKDFNILNLDFVIIDNLEKFELPGDAIIFSPTSFWNIKIIFLNLGNHGLNLINFKRICVEIL